MKLRHQRTPTLATRDAKLYALLRARARSRGRDNRKEQLRHFYTRVTARVQRRLLARRALLCRASRAFVQIPSSLFRSYPSMPAA